MRLPNMRVQRTRSSPSAPHSPLTRRPLGGRRQLSGAMPGLGLLLCLVLLGSSCTRHRMPSVFEVPEGFRGWVLIEHDRPGCPATPVENQKRIYRIPASGRMCVRDSLEYGKFAKDEYYFVGSSRVPIPEESPGHEGLVRAGGVGGPGSRIFEHFFVGTEQELKRQPLMKLYDQVQGEP